MLRTEHARTCIYRLEEIFIIRFNVVGKLKLFHKNKQEPQGSPEQQKP